MDTYLLRKKASECSSRQINLDQYLINRLGLIRSKTYIKLGDYFINCIPYSLGLNTIRVVSILDAKEVALFQNMEIPYKKLHMCFMHHLFPGEIQLFGIIHTMEIHNSGNESKQVMIDLTFESLPNDYIEIFVDLCDILDQAHELYKSEYPWINWQQLNLIHFSDSADLEFAKIRTKAKILQVKTDGIVFAVLDVALQEKMPVHVKLKKDPFQLMLKGEVIHKPVTLGQAQLIQVKLEQHSSFLLILQGVKEVFDQIKSNGKA